MRLHGFWPGFWFRPVGQPGLAAHLLAPLATLTAWRHAWRNRGRAGGAGAGSCWSVPVIHMSAPMPGAEGLIEAALALAPHLGPGLRLAMPAPPGAPGQPAVIDERRDRAEVIGDAALLAAAFLPVHQARDLADAIAHAAAAGARAVLACDPAGDPADALARRADLRLLVVEARRGLGNGRARPAGPLPCPAARLLGASDLVLCIGARPARDAFAATWAVPCVPAQLEPLNTGMAWRGLRVLGFAGSTAPGDLATALRREGAQVVRVQPLEQGQRMTPALLARLEFEARSQGAQLATAEADAVRLPRNWRHRVLTLPLRLKILPSPALEAALARVPAIRRSEGA